MTKFRVLITGVGGGGMGEQILKSLRLSKTYQYFIVGTDLSEFCSGKEKCDHFSIMPSVDDSSYLDRLFQLIDDYDIQFVFPGSEKELKFISKKRGLLEEKGVGHSLNSKNIIELCTNKLATYQHLEGLGFPVPAYKKLDCLEDLKEIDFYPLVLKPNTGSGGSAGVTLVMDPEEAELSLKLMLKQGVDVIAQAHIGSPEEEYTVGVTSDSDGKVLASIVVKRVINNAISTYKRLNRNGKSYVISSGISQGEVCHHQAIQEFSEKMAIALHSRGPLNIQGRWVDDKLLLFEINPRLSGTTPLRTLAGYNEPESMLVRNILGQVYDLSYRPLSIARTIHEVVL